MRKILVFTDMDSNGSGYRNICTPLFVEMSTLDYEIKVVGMMNRGEEHNYPFSIIPAASVEEGQVMMSNLIQLWNPDVVIVALDLPLQIKMHSIFSQYKKKYVAITPLENGPLCMSWAAPLYAMDGVFFISEMGKLEAIKAGVKADHLQIGVDTVSWRPAFPEEKQRIREGLGIPQDAFVILTVADNQERKNLAASMEAVSMLKKEIDRPIRYVIVTREQSPFGWKLRDMAVSFGINQEYTPFERGMPRDDLWGLYAISDVYVQPSKAEGLGLPVLDAMAAKIPVIATNTGALHELLEDNRGFLIPPEYTIKYDVWGNERRDMIDVTLTKDAMKAVMALDPSFSAPAYEYVNGRTWDIPAKQLDKKIKELLDEPKTETPITP